MTATATSEPCLEDSDRSIVIVVVGDDEVKRTLEGHLKMPSICSLVSVEDSAHFHHLGQSFPQLLLILRQLLELVNISRFTSARNGALGCLLLAC